MNSSINSALRNLNFSSLWRFEYQNDVNESFGGSIEVAGHSSNAAVNVAIALSSVACAALFIYGAWYLIKKTG